MRAPDGNRLLLTGEGKISVEIELNFESRRVHVSFPMHMLLWAVTKVSFQKMERVEFLGK